MPACVSWHAGGDRAKGRGIMTAADVVEHTKGLAKHARVAARALARADRATKDAALHAVAEGLSSSARAILEANRADVARFRASGAATEALIDRLTLTEKRLGGV